MNNMGSSVTIRGQALIGYQRCTYLIGYQRCMYLISYQRCTYLISYQRCTYLISYQRKAKHSNTTVLGYSHLWNCAHTWWRNSITLQLRHYIYHVRGSGQVAWAGGMGALVGEDQDFEVRLVVRVDIVICHISPAWRNVMVWCHILQTWCHWVTSYLSSTMSLCDVMSHQQRRSPGPAACGPQRWSQSLARSPCSTPPPWQSHYSPAQSWCPGPGGAGLYCMRRTCRGNGPRT